MDTLAYCGSIWSRNLGDESIYHANNRLFSDFQLLPARHDDLSNTLILGGGTILPRALKSEWNTYDAVPRQYNYCIGVGIRDPEFWNRSKGAIDVRRLLGEYGIDISKYIKRSKPVHYAINRFTPDSLILSEEYCFSKDFKSISEFGFDQISVRGPRSKEILERYGIESTVVGDPALYLQPPEYNREQTNEIIVCLMKPHIGKWDQNTNYVDNLISVLNEEYPQNKITYIPFKHTDTPINLNAAQKTKNADLYTTHHLQFDDILSRISQADLVIGERLHSIILSAACYTPFIALSYRPKHHDFTDSIGMGDYIIKTTDVTSARVKTLLEQVSSDHNLIVNTIENEVSEKREKLENFARQVTSDISSP